MERRGKGGDREGWSAERERENKEGETKIGKCDGESIQSGTYRERGKEGERERREREVEMERETKREREIHSMPRYLVMPWAGYKED